MKYNLNDKYQQQQFKEYCNKLYKDGAKVELKVIRKTRTYKQNRYLHVILTDYGLHLGYSLDEIKTIFKQIICRQDFRYEKNDIVFFKSSADLDTKEMTIAIERLRNHASKEHNHYLPEPHETEMLQSMEDNFNQYGVKQYI